MRLLLTLALALPALAQVQISLSLIQHAAAVRLLNRRAAGIVSPWNGVAANMGAERVMVGEASVLAQIARLQPFDHAAMALIVSDAGQYNLLARLARGGQDLTALGAFIAAGRSLVAPWPEVLAGVAWGGPYLVGRIRGLERPITDSFAALSSGWPLSIEPGAAVPFHVFTARQSDTTAPAQFTLSVGTATVRVAQ